MKYKTKYREVEALQLSANNFDEICKFLGYTPVQIWNPNFGMDEDGSTNDHYLGIYLGSTSGDDAIKVNIGDMIVKTGDTTSDFKVIGVDEFFIKYERVNNN